MGGNQVDFTTVELGSGRSGVVELSTAVSGKDIGDRSVTVLTEDDSTSGTVTVQEPANIDVAISETPEEVSRGESFTLTATATNTGGVETTQTISLSAPDTEIEPASAEVTLDGGESQEVRLDASTTGNTAIGGVLLFVDSADNSAATEVFVPEPPNFELTATSVSNPVFTDETLAIERTVTNTGGESGTADLTLTVGGEEIDTETIEIDPGETVTRIIESDSSPDAEPGVSAIELSDANTGATATATVLLREPLADPFFRVDAPADGQVFQPTEEAPQLDSQQITATANVSNAGEETDTQTVSFTVDGSVLDSEQIELDGSESSDVSFSVNATEVDAGTRTFALATDDTSRETDIVVRAPRPTNFETRSIGGAVDTDIVADGDIVSVTVANTGEIDGTASVSVRTQTNVSRPFTGQATDPVELDAGSTKTVGLRVETGDAARAGEFTGEISVTVQGDGTPRRACDALALPSGRSRLLSTVQPSIRQHWSGQTHQLRHPL